MLVFVFAVYLLDPAALRLRLAEVETPIRMMVVGLEFRLPELYEFALTEIKADGEQSYTSFRRCLYGQQTQVMLHTLGGEVVIAHNHHHVNKSIYRLQALS